MPAKQCVNIRRRLRNVVVGAVVVVVLLLVDLSPQVEGAELLRLTLFNM